MARPADRHLNQDELEALVSSGVSQRRELPSPGDDPGDVSSHMAQCEKCRLLAASYAAVEARLASLRSEDLAPCRADCPPDEEWLSVAAGLLPAERTEKAMQHAANCDHCGPLLRSATKDSDDMLTADEKSVLDGFRTNDREWQRGMAKRLSTLVKDRDPEGKAATARWRIFLDRPRLVFAAGALVLLVLASWAGFSRLRSPSAAERLLAQAYTEQRSLEMRIPGAKHAQIQAERSAIGSSLDKSSFLLRAEALIGENLRRNPRDPAWLEAKARADLLENHYVAAVESLQSALAMWPDSPSLLTDLGTAYYQQAENLHRNSDYGTSIDCFSRALARAPDDPVVLFNRAVVYERIFLLHEAIKDWEHYLKVDASGEWAEEAKKRLQNLREKLKDHDQGLANPLLSPREFATTTFPSQPATWMVVDKRIEEYVDAAIQEWLPAAFPTEGKISSSERQADARAALGALALILASRHRDPWLADLLRTRVSTSLAAGIESLAAAAKANALGDPHAAQPRARLAEFAFQNAGSKAGRLRAQFEEIYALQRQFHNETCLEGITGIEKSVRDSRYLWIALQTKLEMYSCLNSSETQLGRAARLLTAAREGAWKAGYGALYLRALGFAASNETELGSTERAWHWDLLGLATYWSGLYPSLRAQHFYDDLSIGAQDSGKWFLAVALGREAVSAISASPNRSGEGMERMELARSASQAHLWQEATEEYSRALAVFDSLPQDESSRAFHADAEIGLAESQLEQGHVQDAETRLGYARSNLPSDFDEYETWLSLYRTLAKLKQRSGDDTGADRACVAVVVIAESGLHGIHSELERLRWSLASSNCYKRLVDSALRRHDEVSALEMWEWYRSSGVRLASTVAPQRGHFSELAHSAVLPELNEVKHELPSLQGQTVLAYAEMSDRIVAWIYDDRGIISQPLRVIPADLKAVANQFVAQCANPQSDIAPLEVNGRRLYDWLIAPLRGRLDPKRTLVIEADDNLVGVPFAALIDPGGTYIVESFSIGYLPGAGYRQFLRLGKPVTRQDTALVVGEPAISEWDQASYSPLPDADFEAQQVSREFSRSRLLTGAAATATALAEALPAATVFHFAGHARSQPGHSGLLLARDSDTANDVSAMFGSDQIAAKAMPHLNLVVLSACSTSRSTSDGPAGSDSLARAFLGAGIPYVIATRWQVNSAATATLMHLFYQHILSGKPVTAALASSMSYVRTRTEYSHPYYWAAFDAFGRGQ